MKFNLSVYLGNVAGFAALWAVFTVLDMLSGKDPDLTQTLILAFFLVWNSNVALKSNINNDTKGP